MQGNRHDKHPTEPAERVEHPIGFGQPGYPEGNPGQGAAGVCVVVFRLHRLRKTDSRNPARYPQ